MGYPAGKVRMGSRPRGGWCHQTCFHFLPLYLRFIMVYRSVCLRVGDAQSPPSVGVRFPCRELSLVSGSGRRQTSRSLANISGGYPGFLSKNHQPNHLLSERESPALSNLRNTQTGIIENFPSRAYINIMWTIHLSLQFCQIKGKPSLFSHFLLKTFGWYEKNPYLCIRFWERTLLQNSH